MSGKCNIYITYPAKEAAENEGLKTWIDTFIENLQITLPRLMKVKPTYYVKEKDFSDEHYIDFIEKSDVFILILDSVFSDNQAYYEELSIISDALKLKQTNNVIGYSYVFKIARNLNENIHQPEFLKSVLTYNFFEINPFSRKCKIYNFDNEYNTRSWGKLLDLAYDILDSVVYNSDKSQEHDQKFIYLTETTQDQIENKDDIAREVQHFGYRVLPFTTIPNNADELEEMIITNLEHAQMVVQIMGMHYGPLVKNSKYSYPDFQNRVISKYLIDNPNKNIYRIIWIPTGLKSTDQRQQLYLKRMTRDEANVNTEIIEAPIESFKTLLAHRLEQSHEERAIIKHKKSIYLIAEEQYSDRLTTIQQELAENQVAAITLNYQQQHSLYTRHLHNLLEADAVLIYAQESSGFWIRSKIRDLVKAPGIGKTDPFKAIGFISSNKLQQKDIKLLKGTIDYIEPNNKQALQSFINKLN